ncbi:MAG: MFS transporter [Novosphingobium sp.]|nr:MAG: MFS transporter [Novosphingobium sp.]
MHDRPSAEHTAAVPPFADGLATPRRYAAIVAVSLGTMIGVIDTGSLNIALPTLAQELNVAPSSVVTLVTAYQLVLIMTVLPLSALGDRLGHRTLYQCGQALYLVATLLCFVAHSLAALVAIRVAQALGAAATASVASAMIRQIYPQARLGRGMALNTMLATLASTIAPSLGGLILSHARWPWLFAICLPLGAVSLLAGSKALPDPVRRAGRYDLLAALLCAATFGLAVVGMESAVHGVPPLLTGLLLVAAIVIGTAFVRREAEQEHPVLPVDLLRDRQIALSSLAGLAGSIATMIVMITLPFRLQQEFHYTPTEAGLVYAAWPMALVLFAPVSGILSDRFRPGLLGIVGTVLGVTGMILLAFLPAHPEHVDIMWRLVVISAGSGIFFAPNARQIIFAAPMTRAAAAGGLTQTTRMTGQVMGSTITAGLLALSLGSGATPSLVAAALFSISGVSCLVLLGLRPRA